LSVAAHHPDRTSSLALTSIGSDDNDYRNLIIRVWREVLELGGLEALAWVTTTHILGRDFLEAHADQVDIMIKTVKERNSEEALGAMIKALSEYPPSLEEAEQVEAPCALMTSTEDPLVSDKAAEDLAEVLKPTHRWSFDDCGHTIPVEKPKQWRANLLEFLESVQA
jgi:pimeloyl-ACP methyl ester carboxylesterase